MAFPFWGQRRSSPAPPAPSLKGGQVAQVAATVGVSEAPNEMTVQSFDNSNITYRGDLNGFRYDHILRDKQRHIFDLYQLADYYADADEIVHGILRHILVPYSICSPWVLTGVNEKTRKLYEEKYAAMNLREKLASIMMQYWKYANVVVYYMPTGDLITLPIHKCRIGSVMLNGVPIVEYNCTDVAAYWRGRGYAVKENWIEDNDLGLYFAGYPPEVKDAINAGYSWVQLNPANTYVLQDQKEDWQRYAIPFIASCLPALGKKALISRYEDAVLNLGIRSFVHVTYGDSTKGQDMMPDVNQLQQVRAIFSKAMSGYPLAVTNHLAEAKILQPDMDDLFQWNKYENVNTAILSAGGISGMLVNGVSDTGSSFASAQVSMQTAASRIESARDEFCDMMNRINRRIVLDMRQQHTYNLKDVPTFHFMPLDMAGKKALREACTELWEKGLLSVRTLMETQGYSLEREKALKQTEKQDGTVELFRPMEEQMQPQQAGPGRPTLNDDERTSDPADAERGKMPKPSNEDGSLE